MISLKQINIIDYLCNYSKTFPISLDFYMDKVASPEYQDMILLASKEDDACGIAFACQKGETFKIYLISVHPDFRDRSIDRILLDECILTAQRSGAVFVDYYYSCCKWQPHQKEIHYKGFQEQYHTIHYEMFTTDTNRKEWEHLIECHGSRILQRLASRGFCTKKIEDVQPSILKKLYSQIGTRFSAGLDPRDCKGALQEYSAVTLYQDQPVAFLIASKENKGKSIRVEQLSVRFDFFNKGVFFSPISFLVNKAINKNVASITFLVNSENEAMIKLADGVLSFTDARRLHNYVYRCKIPEIL